MFETTAFLLIPVMAIIATVAMLIGLAWLILHYKAQRLERQHRTATLLAEKGLPLPPSLFGESDQAAADLRRGVVLTMLGIALAIGLNDTGAPWTFGLIPLFMGVGYLLVWGIESRHRR